jgi:AcrR family transcriptional regulator
MQLTRKRIIATAMTLIEQDGAEAFSMGTLATELGSGVMALYGHVASRSDLLDSVADQILTSMTAAALPAGDWEDQVRALAAATRQVALTYPRCATLALSRPPLSSSQAAPSAAALAALHDAGVSEQDAAQVARTLTVYVLGSALCEPGSVDADTAFEFGLGMLVGAVAALCPRWHGRQGSQSDTAAAAAATGRATPAPAASSSASSAGTRRAAERPAALAMPPMSTGPPSMPA